MKKILFLAILVLANLCRAADGGELLYWMVMPSTEITVKYDDSSTTGSIESFDVNGARIRYQTEDGTSSGYLPIIGIYPGGNNITFNEMSGAPIPGGYHAALGSYAGSAYSYVLELGNWSNGTWTGTKMESTVATYDYLKAQQHIAQWENDSPSYAAAWKPTEFTAVPEPTSGLLLVLGGAILALRRRSKGVA